MKPTPDKALRHQPRPWPPIPTLEAASPYRARFKDGATIYPRRFFFVERELAGRMVDNPLAPRVRGKVGPLDKRPWKEVEPPNGPVEKEFLRPVLLGESIAPFRLLNPALCVVPVHGREILDLILSIHSWLPKSCRVALGCGTQMGSPQREASGWRPKYDDHAAT